MDELNTENIENADYTGTGGNLPESDLTEEGSISDGNLTASGSEKPKKKSGKHSATFRSAMRGLVAGVVLLAVFWAGYLTNYFRLMPICVLCSLCTTHTEITTFFATARKIPQRL